MKKPSLLAHQALVDMNKMLSFISEASEKQHYIFYLHSISALKSAEHFVLPAYGELFSDDLASVGTTNIATVSFPVIPEAAFNAPFNTFTLEYISPGWFTTKRVCLVQQHEDRWSLIPLWFNKEHRVWVVAKAMCVFWRGDDGLPKYELIDLDTMKKLSGENATEEIGFEMYTLWCFIAALSCKQTNILKRPVPKKLPREAGLTDSYHIVDFFNNSIYHTPEQYRQLGIDCRHNPHRSPRTHLRRGHIRRLHTGGLTWVRNSLVNPKAIGTIEKHYGTA